jgi:peptide/nickel transport system ATP-binding protein
MSELEVDQIHVEYLRREDRVRAVVGVSLSLVAGEIMGLVGESGCGKSSLARAIVGLERPTSGRVLLDGRALEPLSRRSRPKLSRMVQMVFQNPYASLNPRRRIIDQVQDAAIGPDRASRRAEALEVLDQVGVGGKQAAAFPHQLSGGQRQRVAIARALAQHPHFLILDEPLASLDTSTQAQIANLLGELAQRRAIGMLLISHDLAIVQQVASRVAVMYLGVIVESGPNTSVWARPLHPYTEGLINSTPAVDMPGAVPHAVLGEIPDPAHPPTGCRFHPRCPYVMDRCRTETPPLIQVEPGRLAACWLQKVDQPKALG